LIELVLRIGFSLLIVFGLMWALAKVARRPLTGNRGTGNLAVLTRQQLSRSSSVAIVQVADRAYVLGVTDTQVNLLAETEVAAFERHPHPAAVKRAAVPVDPADPAASPVELAHGRLHGSALSPRTWKAALDFLRERTARR
jgi:flagellar protein FliO/FliZ